MSPQSDVLDEAQELIKRRLSELDDERRRLERALADIGGSGGSTKRGPGRPRGSRSSLNGSSRGGKRRRSRKGGTRAEHALDLIRENPGISAGDIAKQLGMKPNYMYRVMGELQKDGLVRKEGRGYHVNDSPQPDSSESVPAEA